MSPFFTNGSPCSERWEKLQMNDLGLATCKQTHLTSLTLTPALLLIKSPFLGIFDEPTVLTYNTLLIILVALLLLWGATVIYFLFKIRQQKNKYIQIVDNHLKDLSETTHALNESDLRYQQLINNLGVGLLFTDAHNSIRFCNPAACSILKTTPENMIQRTLKSFVLGETELLQNVEGDHSPPASHTEEVQMIRGDGEVIWAGLSISYPLDFDHHPGGSVIVLTDNTHKKQAENKLNTLTVDLNQKIKQLNCLFDISDITGVPGISFDGIFERSLVIIPNGLKYSHDVCTEISFGEKRYASENFTDTPWSFTVPIRVQKKKLGHIKVGYVEEKPKIKKDPFHINEKILLKNIAEKLGQIIEARNIQNIQHPTVYGKSIIDK